MAAAVRASTDLLDGGEYECSAFASLDGVSIKARADVYHPDRALIDIKTTTDASPDAIRRTVHKLGYHVQAAHYLTVFDLVWGADYYLIVVEKQPPHLVTVCLLRDAWIEAGLALCRTAYERWRDCTETGIWPGYATGVVLLDMPPWMTRTDDPEEI